MWIHILNLDGAVINYNEQNKDIFSNKLFAYLRKNALVGKVRIDDNHFYADC